MGKSRCGKTECTTPPDQKAESRTKVIRRRQDRDGDPAAGRQVFRMRLSFVSPPHSRRTHETRSQGGFVSCGLGIKRPGTVPPAATTQISPKTESYAAALAAPLYRPLFQPP